jgi:hypothetical protein
LNNNQRDAFLDGFYDWKNAKGASADINQVKAIKMPVIQKKVFFGTCNLCSTCDFISIFLIIQNNHSTL